MQRYWSRFLDRRSLRGADVQWTAVLARRGNSLLHASRSNDTDEVLDVCLRLQLLDLFFIKGLHDRRIRFGLLRKRRDGGFVLGCSPVSRRGSLWGSMWQRQLLVPEML